MITNANRSLLQHLGYSREELVGKKRMQELAAVHSLFECQALITAMLNSQDTQQRLDLRSHSGDLKPVQCNLSSYSRRHKRLIVGRCSLMDISAQVELELSLTQKANCDPLTNAFNRRHFNELAERELSRALRHDLPLTLLALDIDHFKFINDTYGHDAGDEVLRSIVHLCQGVLRKSDIFARFGGEEFIILLPHTSLQNGAHKAEQIRELLARSPTEVAGCGQIHYTVSIGVESLDSLTEPSLKERLNRADMLYQAKQNGRNRVCCRI